ncbi:MAG: DUF1640 domain-containing protein [Methylococcales bacterium]|nr:DUF1640 domain-containing protein [Methylococcales bacterium]
MSATVLNIHEFYNELKSVGFNEQQAELIANLHSKTATAAVEQAKHDYKLDDTVTNRDLDARIKETEFKIELVRREIADVKFEIIKWVVGTAFASVSLMFIILRFFGKA